jgi:CTP synthase (UTP-ammonia lyase)
MWIAIVGDRDLAHLTHREIEATRDLLAPEARLEWVATDSPRARDLSGASGVWLAPGTPYRDASSVFASIDESLARRRPLLATCGGFQHVAVRLAKTLAGIEGAAHQESDPDGVELVVQQLACALRGQYRPVRAIAGSKVAQACGLAPFPGFHMCGYGVAEPYVPALERAGVTISARSEDAGVEALELPEHPFFVATLFQPQVGASESGTVHPLVRAFVAAALRCAAALTG